MDWSFPGEGRARIDVRDFPASNDFVGVNYYSRVHIRFRGVPGAVGQFLYRDPEVAGPDRHGLGDPPAGLRPRSCGRPRARGVPSS